METETYVLPEFWAVAFFNGDESAFNEEDLRAFEAWLDDHSHLSGPVAMENQGDFLRYHDAQPYGVLACECAEYIFPVLKGFEQNV